MEYLTTKNKKLIPNSDYEFLSDYYDASSLFDFYFLDKWESLILTDRINKAIENDSISVIEMSVMSCINYNEYKYNKLYATLGLEYNPLDNVNASTTNVYGAISNTKVKGAQTDVHERDAKQDTVSLGARSDTVGAITTTRGANTIVEKNNMYGFNTTATDGVNADKKTIDNGSYTDTTGSHTDSIGAQSNTTNYGKDRLTDTMGQRSDTDTTQTHTDTITRVGNIGVTSSQELLKQEREVAIFNFYEYVFNDILNYITIGVFENDY